MGNEFSAESSGPKDSTHKDPILQTMASGIPLVLGLRTWMQDPYVYVHLGPL